MDLKSGYPFWAVKNGLPATFPPLARDRRCEVAVLGAGISGALIAHELATHGFDVTVLDERDVAWGSTAASTALIQYEIDTHLTDLARRYGLPGALLAYRSCVEAIGQLRDVVTSHRHAGWRDCESLYYASRARDAKTLAREFALREANGFDVEWLDAARLRTRYGIAAPAAILNRPAAGFDPYRLTYDLLQRLRRNGTAVFDHTAVAQIRPRSRDVLLTTREGLEVRAARVVIAAGYAGQRWLARRVARHRSSYAFVTDPIDPALLGPLDRTLVWESARPYRYLRATADHRLIVGGEDDAIDVPARRDRRVASKVERLRKAVHRQFPHLPLLPAFSWAGTFAETHDGLPYFGAHPQYGPRVLFAMAYGGNGITYSMLGANLLRAVIERRPHPLASLFAFDRARR